MGFFFSLFLYFIIWFYSLKNCKTTGATVTWYSSKIDIKKKEEEKHFLLVAICRLNQSSCWWALLRTVLLESRNLMYWSWHFSIVQTQCHGCTITISVLNTNILHNVLILKLNDAIWIALSLLLFISYY